MNYTIALDSLQTIFWVHIIRIVGEPFYPILPKTTGQSPHQHLTERRIERAAKLIAENK